MEGLITFSEAAGQQAEAAVKGAAAGIDVRTASAPAETNIAAISRGMSCCSIQRQKVQELKTNLTADAENIGALAEKFMAMDQEQGQNNLNSLLSGPGLNGSLIKD